MASLLSFHSQSRALQDQAPCREAAALGKAPQNPQASTRDGQSRLGLSVKADSTETLLPLSAFQSSSTRITLPATPELASSKPCFSRALIRIVPETGLPNGTRYALASPRYRPHGRRARLARSSR
jgi:hypothetical protein